MFYVARALIPGFNPILVLTGLEKKTRWGITHSSGQLFRCRITPGLDLISSCFGLF